MSFVVFAVVLMIPLVLNQETPGYYFAGGILGIVSSVKMSSFSFSSRDAGNRFGFSSAERVEKIIFYVIAIFPRPV